MVTKHIYRTQRGIPHQDSVTQSAIWQPESQTDPGAKQLHLQAQGLPSTAANPSIFSLGSYDSSPYVKQFSQSF